MAKSSKQSTSAAKKAEQKQKTTTARADRAKHEGDEANKVAAPTRKAREVRDEFRRKRVAEDREREIDLAARQDEDQPKKSEKPTMLDGKPGSGAGLKPGDLFAPKSNPGAAARVPDQPLSPDSMQSHGKGILFDKDLDNGAYATGNAEAIDEGPSGSDPRVVDKDAERKKADKATPRFKQNDPDNPSIGYKGKDATASPNPIGSRHRSKTDTPGGSNSGSEP